eukprot:Colp12_sorted_trinity150504_noHs@32217
MIIRVPEWRVKQIRALLLQIKRLKPCTQNKRRFRVRISFKSLESLAGKLVHVSPLVAGSKPFTSAFFKTLQAAKQSVKGWHRNPHFVTLTDELFHHTEWWLRCLRTWNHTSLLVPPMSDTDIFTDASNWGFGLAFGSEHISDAWSAQTTRLHINTKETIAVWFALKRWAPELQDHGITFHIDNTTAIAHLKKGHARAPQAQRAIEKFWLKCAQFRIRPSFRYIHTSANTVADALSRGVLPSSTPDWPVVDSVFQLCDIAVGPHTVDLMASASNTRCARYFSRTRSALCHDWAGENAWCNPDFALVQPLLEHFFAIREHAPSTSLSLLVPEWPSQSWWPLVAHMQPLWRFPAGAKLFINAQGQVLSTQWPVCIFRWNPN